MLVDDPDDLRAEALHDHGELRLVGERWVLHIIVRIVEMRGPRRDGEHDVSLGA